MAEQKTSSALTAPLRNAASAVRKVPGAGAVTKAAEGTLDKIGAVSPRGRRMAVYAGAGVLGVAGVVEWPVALTGAAVAWLTQPRPGQGESPAMTATTAETTESAGHGAYVAMGDAVTEPGPGAGVAGPGPLRGDEMPDGPATASAGSATTAAAAAALGPDAPSAAPHDQPAPADLDRPTGQHLSTGLDAPAEQDATAGPGISAEQDTAAGPGGPAEQDTAAEPGTRAEPYDLDPYDDPLAPPTGSTAPGPADEDDSPHVVAPPADPTAPPAG